MTEQLQTDVAIGKHCTSHERVDHDIKQYARGVVHINKTESFNAVLERAKQGVFHFFSRRHLLDISMKLPFDGTTATRQK